jgi:hypothetical protein
MNDDHMHEPGAWPEVMERCVEEEVLEWYRMTPQERWDESMRLWQTYLLLGGSLDPEPDSQSPFYDPSDYEQRPGDSAPRLRAIRRGGV